jgi:alkylated DNA repair dioxygenase AlkB
MEGQYQSLVSDAEIYLVKSYVANPDILFDLLNDNTKFCKHALYFYDWDKREMVQKEQSRSSYWFGDYAQIAGGTKSVNKITEESIDLPVDYVDSYEFIPEILELKNKIEADFNVGFNSCLVGKFDSPTDRVGFHSDAGQGLGRNPFVASVSFGKARKFFIKSTVKGSKQISMILEHGDLLMMRNNSNVKYMHMVPPDPNCNKDNCRINLTFRNYTYSQDEINHTLNKKSNNQPI